MRKYKQQKLNNILPLTEQFVTELFKNAYSDPPMKILVIQHLLEDTESFIKILRNAGFIIEQVIGIEYSSKRAVLERLAIEGINVVIPSFANLRRTIRKSLKTLKHNKHSSKEKIIIHEVGGYCADILKEDANLVNNNCIGFIEETKQGLWRYEKMNSFNFPLIHIANSRLKDFEGFFIGEAVAKSILEDLNTLKIKSKDCRAGLLGFGSIGNSVARSLKRHGLNILFFDSDPIKQIEGAVLGYTFASRKDVLEKSQIIIGSTGKRSIAYNDLLSLENNAILASASSRTVEFPVDHINKTGKMNKINMFIDDYLMPWGKSLRIINKGYPINFRHSSLTSSIADLMFCQIAACIKKLMSNNLVPGIHILSDKDEEQIARLWIDYYLLQSGYDGSPKKCLCPPT